MNFLRAAVVGQDYSQQLEAVDGKPPYSWSSDPLPAELSLGSASGRISGRPTQKAAKKSYEFKVKDADGKEATMRIELEVK